MLLHEQNTKNPYAILLRLINATIKISLIIPIGYFAYKDFQQNHDYKKAGKIFGKWLVISGALHISTNALEYYINNFIANRTWLVNRMHYVPLIGNSMQKFFRERKEILEYYKKPEYQVVDLTDDTKSPYEPKLGNRVVPYTSIKKAEQRKIEEEAKKPKEILKVKMTQKEYDQKVEEMRKEFTAEIMKQLDDLQKHVQIVDAKMKADFNAHPEDQFIQTPAIEVQIPEEERKKLKENIEQMKKTSGQLPEKQKKIIQEDIKTLQEITSTSATSSLPVLKIDPKSIKPDYENNTDKSVRDGIEKRKEQYKGKPVGWFFS